MAEREDRRMARLVIWSGLILVLGALLTRGCTPAPAPAWVTKSCEDAGPGEACVDRVETPSGWPHAIQCKAGKIEDSSRIRAWCCFAQDLPGVAWQFLGCVPAV